MHPLTSMRGHGGSHPSKTPAVFESSFIHTATSVKLLKLKKPSKINLSSWIFILNISKPGGHGKQAFTILSVTMGI